MSLPAKSTDLGRALRATLDGIERSGGGMVPRIQGLTPHQTARALLLASGGVGPLLYVEARHLGGACDTWWEVAEGGWVLVFGPSSAVPGALRDAAEVGRIALFEVSGSPALPAPAGWLQSALDADASFEVALDPALDPLRRSLLSHCRGANPVLLAGDSGTDRLALGQWAHAELDDRPMSHLDSSGGDVRAGEWLLVEEPASLSPDTNRLLQERLRGSQPTPTRRRGRRGTRRPNHPAFEGIVGASPALAEVLQQALIVGATRLPALVLGEPGAGKEAMARALHTLSRRKGPFIALDMGALPESVAESELFGHGRGAFTGADRARRGAFRSADGGTLFLDEIGNLSTGLQAKLLRVLQEGVFRPVGEDREVRVDVRVVAATNADLHARARTGEFRPDLLGRLDGATLRVPPLRDRLEDIDLLAPHLLEAEGERPTEPWCTPAARKALIGHAWPGNVRELGNILHFAAAVAPSGQPIDAEHLGALAPDRRRPTPLLVISSTEPGQEARTWRLDRQSIQRLTATTLRVPPLRDRGAASLRHRVLCGLAGRPVSPEAMRLLTEAPWWGNGPELRAALGAIASLAPGVVGEKELREHLPHLADRGNGRPMRTLIAPTRDGARIGGLIRDIAAGAMLIGRVESLEPLRLAAQRGDRRSEAWLECIEEACGRSVEPACLDLGLLRRISRAHVLVTRAPGGLQVRAMPGAGLPVQAGPLVSGAPLASLSSGAAAIGDAGEIRLVNGAGDPYLQLFVFAGAVAFDDHAEEALARSRASRRPSGPTLQESKVGRTAPIRFEAQALEQSALRVWALDEDEIAALVGLLMSYRGGRLSDFLTPRLPGLSRRGGCARLSRFLEQAPRLSQYLARLVEFGPNEALREQLRAALDAAPDGAIRIQLWPKGVGRALR